MRPRPALLILLVSFLAAGLAAATHRIDQRTYSAADPSAYYLVFCARGGSATGHAFVAWGAESEERKVSAQDAFGFYPESGRGILRRVPGSIMNEAFKPETALLTDRLIVRVDEEIFDVTKKSIAEWSTKDYNLFEQNCIDFVRSVATTTGLKVPSRGATQLPSDYMQALIKANRR